MFGQAAQCQVLVILHTTREDSSCNVLLNISAYQLIQHQRHGTGMEADDNDGDVTQCQEEVKMDKTVHSQRLR